jgi:hypothetical protein
MTKKAVVIIQALKNLGLTDEDLKFYYKKIYKKKFYEIGDVMMPLVKRCEDSFEREVLEIHKSRSTALHKEKQYTEGFIDGINYKIDGLNEVHGGSGGLGIELPMYDVSMMLMLGYQYKSIKDYLSEFYNIQVSLRQIKKRISSYFSGDYERGSRYTANKEFLKSIIEILLYEQYLGKLDEKQYLKVLSFLKSIVEKEDKKKLKTWFWTFYMGDTNLDFAYWKEEINEINKDAFKKWINEHKRHYGILKSTWIEWIIKRKPIKRIIEETKLSRKQVKRIRSNLNSNEILRNFQRYIIIKNRKEGIPWKEIYENKLNYSDFHRTDKTGIKNGPDFFKRIFLIPFSELKLKIFDEVNLNQSKIWNNIDFSEFE